MTTFSRMQKLAGLKEFEEFNADDFGDEDIKDLMKLGFGGVKEDDPVSLTAVSFWGWEKDYRTIVSEAEYEVHQTIVLPAQVLVAEIESNPNDPGDSWDFLDLNATKEEFKEYVQDYFDNEAPNYVFELIEKYADQVEVEIYQTWDNGIGDEIPEITSLEQLNQVASYKENSVNVLVNI
jgi:hypothetical protein